MDLRNRKHVKVYCRPPGEVKVMGWKALAVERLLVTELDPQGRIKLYGQPPAEVASASTGMPLEICTEGMERLLQLSIFVVEGDALWRPMHIAEQATAKSAAQRKREQRERERAVTNRDMSHAVTRGHTRTQNVTSEILAKREGQSRDVTLPPDVAQYARQLLKIWDAQVSNGLPNGSPSSQLRYFAELWPALVKRNPTQPCALFERAVKSYVAQCAAKHRHPKVQWFCADFAEYADPPPRPRPGAAATPEDRTLLIKRLRDQLQTAELGMLHAENAEQKAKYEAERKRARATLEEMGAQS